MTEPRRYHIEIEIRPSDDLPGVLVVEALGYVSRTRPGGDDTAGLSAICEALSMVLDTGSDTRKAEMMEAIHVVG